VLGIPDFKKLLKHHYKYLCLVKHGNPELQRAYGVEIQPGMRLQRGPFKADYTVGMARMAINISIRCVLVAITPLRRGPGNG
jgi:hypothetical protein